MHHVTLTRCLAVLGLSACASPDVGSQAIDPVTDPHIGSNTVEPSGLDMQPHAAKRESETEESVPGFESTRSHWCNVSIDTHARKLEPTPSFLQAWNLVAANGQPPTRYFNMPPHTEDDARVRICGLAGCTIDQPAIVQAMSGGGVGSRAGTARVGFGVMLPFEQGPLVVPISGADGTCAVAPELRVERSGSLVHVTAIVHEGDYNRTYFHGEYDKHYAPAPIYNGECMTLSSVRTDIVVDVATARLELVLTQTRSRDGLQPLIEVTLDQRGVEMAGCAEVLEIAWTG